MYRLESDVESTDGQSFSWEANTQGLLMADMWINDHRVNISHGNMFLVSSQDDGTQVDQEQRGFSELEPSIESITALASIDPIIAYIIALSEL